MVSQQISPICQQTDSNRIVWENVIFVQAQICTFEQVSTTQRQGSTAVHMMPRFAFTMKLVTWSRRTSTRAISKSRKTLRLIQFYSNLLAFSEPFEIAIKVKKRRKFLRFPITRCNLLRPRLLCHDFLW